MNFLRRLLNPETKRLISALNSTDVNDVRRATGALTAIGAPAVKPLIRALKHQAPLLRANAAFALGEIKDARAVAPLIATVLREPPGEAEWEASRALTKIGPPAVGPLVEMLRNPDESIREKIVAKLGAFQDGRAVEALIAELKDQDESVRSMAAYALKDPKDARAVEPLVAALRDDHGNTRRNAAWALGEINDARAVAPLIASLKDAESGVRAQAAESLGSIKREESVEALIVTLKDPERTVQEAAKKALVTIGTSRAMEAATAEPFRRRREPGGWSGFASSIGVKGTSHTEEPRLLLCCKTPRMAEAVLTGRPPTTDAFLSGQPLLVEFDDGTAAVGFDLEKGHDLSAFVDELFKGRYGDENVEIVSGLAAAAPADQVKRVVGLFGAKEAIGLGDVAMW